MNDFAYALVPIACGCVLPIVAIWLGIRHSINETNKRTEILLAAIEKNPDMDIEELIKKISPKKKLLKEKLLAKLQSGCITSMLGIALIAYNFYLEQTGHSGLKSPVSISFIGLILLGVGIAFLINYYVGKKMLAKEIEAEEKRMMTQE